MLRIRGGERALVGWLVALFATVQASHGLGANAADALFFQRFGVEQLPYMILLTGPAVMISILGHSSGLAYRGATWWLPRVTSICAVWAGAEWVGALLDRRAVYPVIWISTQVIMMVSLTVMWNAASASCTTRQAKRLFPIFATAGVAGGVLGNLSTGPLAATVGTANVLLAQALLLGGGALLLVRVRSLFGDHDDQPDSVARGLAETWSTIRSSKFLIWTAVVAVAMFCLFYLVYFPFSEAVAAAFDTEAATAGFLGVFSSIATAATFLFSLFVTNRLFSRLGLALTLMIVPVVYASGFAVWLIVFGLVSAAIVRGLQWVTVNAIALTAYNALLNVVSRRDRGQVASFMIAVPAQVGVSLAGLLLIVTTDMPTETLFMVGLVMAVATLAVVAALRREYLKAVVSAVRRGVIGLFDAPARTVFTPTDADSVRILKGHLADPRPGARALAVAGMGRLGEGVDASDLEQFLSDTDPRVRSAAFDSVCSIEPERVSAHAARAINDEVPAVRLQVIHYLAAHPEEDGSSIAISALDDPDPRVRAAAATIVGGETGGAVISELLGSDDPVAVAAALEETSGIRSSIGVDPTPYLDHRSPLVRATAADTYPRSGVDTASLRDRLEDRSPRVRTAAAVALARDPAGRALLTEALETGSVIASESALRALTPGDGFMDQLGGWARQEAERAALLDSLAAALDTTDPGPARSALLSVLEMRSRRLTEWVVLAMTTTGTRTIMPLVAKGVRSADPETRSQAIEALETIGARDVLGVLLPLLEPDGTKNPLSAEEALQILAEDFDPWLRALAHRVSAEDSFSGRGTDVASLAHMDQPETQAILDVMERVLVLQRVRMFSDLDPEDLDLIARATSERTYEPDAAIFHQGHIGDEMLVLIEGSAVVSVGEGAGRRIVRTYGAGEHVGELSLLAGGTRSANVHAGSEGARGLALSASDLLTVLEERPTVAMGMLGTLARRLIEQT